jgi:hypothetical protein
LNWNALLLFYCIKSTVCLSDGTRYLRCPSQSGVKNYTKHIYFSWYDHHVVYWLTDCYSITFVKKLKILPMWVSLVWSGLNARTRIWGILFKMMKYCGLNSNQLLSLIFWCFFYLNKIWMFFKGLFNIQRLEIGWVGYWDLSTFISL